MTGYMSITRDRRNFSSQAWLDNRMSRVEPIQKRLGEAINGMASDNAPYWLGNLANSLETLTVRERALIRTEVVAKSKYAAAWEKGRRAGSKPPPVDALLAWVEDKLGAQIDAEIAGTNRNRDSAVRSVAFLVARAIGRDGWEGTWFMREALETLYPYYREELIAALREGMM